MKKIPFVLSILTILVCGCVSTPKTEEKSPYHYGGEGFFEVMRSHLKEVRICYEKSGEVEKTKELRQLVFRWHISGEGKAYDISLIKELSEIQNEELIQCIQYAISKWQFPPSEKTGETPIIYPYYFMAAPAAQ